ncbi:MAG: glycosyltransferase family 2 protein [Syntrophobacterales bacterium]|jgi:glycosyltransferase involved in cell wall biosynthesis
MGEKISQPIEFTLILPGFNEEEVVSRSVEECHTAIKKNFSLYEIILINDCSSDSTGKEMEKAATMYPEVRVYHNRENLGQAVSLKKGFEMARGEIVMHNAFDLPFNPRDIDKIKNAMSEDVDIVVVERQDRRSYSLSRKLISLTNVMILKALFRCPFADYNFVQAYRRKVLDTIPIKTQAVSSVTPELIIRSYRANFSIKSIKLPYHERKTGKSTIRVKHVADALIDTLKLWWYLKSNK